MANNKPSYDALNSPGLSWEPIKEEKKETKVTTQKHSTPTPSSRGYA